MRKKNKAQVIIITLWIMIILGLLAISVANRVSLGLRLSRYARDGIKADALAMAGINRAVAEIANDTNLYDALSEPWANDETKFKEIKADENNDNEVFSVVYNKTDLNGKTSPVYGISDEDSKININAADEDLVRILLEEFDIAEAGTLARNIVAWRGDSNIPVDDPSRDYSLKNYSCKDKPFSNKEELLLVKDITTGTYDMIKDYITTDTDPSQIRVNINTASLETLSILIKYEILSNSLGDSAAGERLLSSIISQRNLAPFETLADVEFKLDLPNKTEEYNVFNYLQTVVDVQSQYFRIISTGIIKKPFLARSSGCVYDNASGKIASWHQN
ncbi:MAG: hypothetical protein WCY12_00240 [Candidatus Omnitrophota bacterium]|jgi:type II secretory pathway component PulK